MPGKMRQPATTPAENPRHHAANNATHQHADIGPAAANEPRRLPPQANRAFKPQTLTVPTHRILALRFVVTFARLSALSGFAGRSVARTVAALRASSRGACNVRSPSPPCGGSGPGTLAGRSLRLVWTQVTMNRCRLVALRGTIRVFDSTLRALPSTRAFQHTPPGHRPDEQHDATTRRHLTQQHAANPAHRQSTSPNTHPFGGPAGPDPTTNDTNHATTQPPETRTTPTKEAPAGRDPPGHPHQRDAPTTRTTQRPRRPKGGQASEASNPERTARSAGSEGS